ncbi:hypothetical protein DFJ58DRAFT_734017 [Suillus subalutaceus]|uniref:uncharacterized protein n=1 Tax=Suillus subalutaceus TaxID=48586 RepID=UPI001B867209|nr:uncharacterized protein DFJ58DRAFT_734017 [Suillus subalutaceus]KAG1838096.1 hypothetical protein DFJ58DRAFT_734017 [Suillus subalutaceus]
MQPSRQLVPPNVNEISHFDASRNLYALVNMTRMPVPPQLSWPENDGGHALMQFSVSESGPGSDKQLPTNNDSEPELYNAGLQMMSMPQLPQQDPQNLDAPAIGAMHNQPGPSQFHAPMFTDTSMHLQLYHQNLDTPAFGAMYNNVMNLSIAQSPYLATRPLHYYPSPNMGSFYPDFSEPVMLKGKDVALPQGTKHEPHQEVMFVDEDITSSQHGEQHQQGSKVQSTFKFREYHGPPKKRGKVATRRVEKSSSQSRAFNLVPSTALPITASAPSTSTYRVDLVYDQNNTKHQRIVDSAEQSIITDAINENCLTDLSTRQQLVLQELRAAAVSEYKDEDKQKIACNIVQLGYHLRSPARAATTEPEHQAGLIIMLIDDTIVFLPRYVFGEDEDTHELHFLENVMVWNVFLNTIVEHNLYPYLHKLNKMFCAAAVAVKCALMKLRTGKLLEIDFTFQRFRHIYEDLLKHIDEDRSSRVNGSEGLGLSSCAVPLTRVHALNFRMKSEGLPETGYSGGVLKDFPW